MNRVCLLYTSVYELRAKENILDPADRSVKYKKGALVATLTTDKNGNATKTGLYLGKYTLKETKASTGSVSYTHLDVYKRQIIYAASVTRS